MDPRGNKLSVAKKRAGLACIRYADDFVILHKDQSVLELARTEVQNWLARLGLKLNEAKTQFTHTDTVCSGKVGFDFLGFNIRRYAAGLYGRNKWGVLHRTYVKPAKKSIKNHLKQIDAVLQNTKQTEVVLSKLIPIVRGWCKYYKTMSSKKTFGKLRKILFIKLWRWARRKHFQRGTE